MLRIVYNIPIGLNIKDMKKTFLTVTAAALLLSGCTTYTGVGAYQGSGIGSIIGSAIGGITGGARGSDIGTLIGMAGGAAVGAAIGSAVDNSERERRYEEYRSDRMEYERRNSYENRTKRDDSMSSYDDRGSGYDPTNSGDDRIYDYNDIDYNSDYSASTPRSFEPSTSNSSGVSALFNPELEIRNARFVDEDMDKTLRARETSKVIFEVYNNSDRTLFDVQPIVEETSGSKQIYISPSIHVESIAPHRGIRYTAMVKAGNRLKNGTAHFRIRAIQGNEQVTSRITEFDVSTSRK